MGGSETTWVIWGLGLIGLLVFGAYGYAFSVAHTLRQHTESDALHPNQRYLDQRFTNIEKKLDALQAMVMAGFSAGGGDRKSWKEGAP